MIFPVQWLNITPVFTIELDCLPWRKISYKPTFRKEMSSNFLLVSLKKSHTILCLQTLKPILFSVSHHPTNFHNPCLLSSTHSLVFPIHFCFIAIPCSWAQLYLFGFLLCIWGRKMPIYKLDCTILTRSPNPALSHIYRKWESDLKTESSHYYINKSNTIIQIKLLQFQTDFFKLKNL